MNSIMAKKTILSLIFLFLCFSYSSIAQTNTIEKAIKWNSFNSVKISENITQSFFSFDGSISDDNYPGIPKYFTKIENINDNFKSVLVYISSDKPLEEAISIVRTGKYTLLHNPVMLRELKKAFI